jgi:hypothetical protein
LNLTDDFIRETAWPYSISEFNLHQFLISIENVEMKRQDGIVYYISKSADSEHIVNLINRQRKVIKPVRRMSRQSSPISISTLSVNSTINSECFKRPMPMSSFPPNKKISLIQKRTSDNKSTSIRSTESSTKIDENNNNMETSNVNSSVISSVCDRWKEFDVNVSNFLLDHVGEILENLFIFSSINSRQNSMDVLLWVITFFYA